MNTPYLSSLNHAHTHRFPQVPSCQRYRHCQLRHMPAQPATMATREEQDGTFLSALLFLHPSISPVVSAVGAREAAETRIKVAGKPLCANNLPIKLFHPSFSSRIPLFLHVSFIAARLLPLLSGKRMPSQEGSGEGSLWRGPSRTHSIRVQGHRHYRAPFLSLQ